METTQAGKDRDVKVIGIGLGKTGTTSLAVALNKLGIPCAHYPSRRKMDRILRGEPLPFQACCDWPVCVHWRELVQIYPDAKFILTWRNLEDWLLSRLAHVARNQQRGRGWRETDPAQDRLDWKQHNNQVREFFADRPNFLELRICDGEGYEKLCPFLRLPVIDEPFPHKKRTCATSGQWRSEWAAERNVANNTTARQ